MSTEMKGKKLQMRGRVVKIGGTETVGAKRFQKRLLVVNDEDDLYPQDIPFWFVQDNVTRLDAVHEGDDIIVTFDLSGREWSGKYYAELRGWKVAKYAEQPANTTTHASAPTPPAAAPAAQKTEEDLPF